MRKPQMKVPIYITWNSGHVETKWADDALAAKKLRDQYLRLKTCEVEIGVVR